jgi:hypothetical protein
MVKKWFRNLSTQKIHCKELNRKKLTESNSMPKKFYRIDFHWKKTKFDCKKILPQKNFNAIKFYRKKILL